MADETAGLTTEQVQQACTEARARLIQVIEEPEVGSGKLVVQSYLIQKSNGSDVTIAAADVSSVAQLTAKLRK